MSNSPTPAPHHLLNPPGIDLLKNENGNYNAVNM